jgi:hypothetical protein
MKFKLFALAIVFVLVFSLVGYAQPVKAIAYGTAFTTSITYQNVGTGEATIHFDFYAGGSGTAIPIDRPNLAVNAASSIYIGGIGLDPGFQGSAVLSSNQPIAAALVQVPAAASTVKNRPLSTGFSAGAASVLVPTVLKATFSTNSIFVIQNVDTVGADLTVTFIPISGAPVIDNVTNLPSGSAKYYDMGTFAPVGSTFNGSVRVVSVKTGTSTAGAVVATSLELATNSDNTYAFEGAMDSALTLYMPSALCSWGPSSNVHSSYAVQNVDTVADASVTVTYAGGGTDGPYVITPGQKRSFAGCAVNTTGYIGSATITATGANVVAVGKIFGGGYSTAYNGFTTGYEKVALPYVRYTNTGWATGTRQRVFIAVQNVGSGEIPINGITVSFYNLSGTLVGTTTNPAAIAVGGKWSTSAAGLDGNEFGYVGGTGGAAIVQGPVSSKLAVIARAQTYLTSTTSANEDYSAIPVP